MGLICSRSQGDQHRLFIVSFICILGKLEQSDRHPACQFESGQLRRSFCGKKTISFMFTCVFRQTMA
jgi:hypothetical protein